MICASRSAFSSSARFSLLLFSRRQTPAAPDDPKPSAPTTTIVVFAFTSSAVAPPRRTTSARASRRPSETQFPGEDDNLSVEGAGSLADQARVNAIRLRARTKMRQKRMNVNELCDLSGRCNYDDRSVSE